MRRLLSILLVLLLLPLSGSASGFSSEDKTVGTDILFESISDVYYTYDASTDPPHYQRFRLYTEDGEHFLYHETREGGDWPQTEEDITVSGTVKLTEDQWAAFCDTLLGGSATVREVTDGDGDAGPWLFIYWNGGEEEGREFRFKSRDKSIAFEEICFQLRSR